MKVLHVIPSLSAVHGGPTRALHVMEQALLARGIDVETATTDDDGPGRHNGRPCAVALREDGVVRRYFRKSADPYKISPAFARWICRSVRDYDLVHIHALFSFTSTAAACAARRAGVPYLVRPLGTLDRYGLSRRRPWAKRLSLALVEGPMLRHAAAVHFTSEMEARQARELGIGWREAIVPLAAGAAPHQPGTRARARGRTILFLSRLDPKKNLEGLLEAIALLAPEFADLHLVVAGDGDSQYAAALKQRAQRLHIDARVEWAGHVAGQRKEQALREADVFALPSHSENFGLAAAEALAHGLPCVLGAGVALAADVVAAGAGVAVAADAAAIAAGLRGILEDEALRAAMGERAAALSRERFSMEAIGARLEQLYTDILNDKHGLPGSR